MRTVAESKDKHKTKTPPRCLAPRPVFPQPVIATPSNDIHEVVGGVCDSGTPVGVILVAFGRHANGDVEFSVGEALRSLVQELIRLTSSLSQHTLLLHSVRSTGPKGRTSGVPSARVSGR
jgi:hypothetical protein